MINYTRIVLLFGAFAFLLNACASSGISRTSGVAIDNKNNLKLDVYTAKKISGPKNVIVFVHGGRWKTGKRSQYRFLGNRLAHKGMVVVIVDYRLSPKASYKGMAMDVARGVQWTKENIHSYGGDNQRIFVAGHSSGGHLAALVSTDKRYFDSLKVNNPIKGTILIDAFGLDMYSFLSNESFRKNPVYYDVFTKDAPAWKDGSPIYHLNKSVPPSLLFIGGRTYPVIQEQTREYLKALTPYHSDTRLVTVRKKKHIPMILQFYNADNGAYSAIAKFVDGVK